VALWAAEIATVDIEASFIGISLLLVIAIIAMGFEFKKNRSSE
jgi:hypothetical protein